MLGLGTALSGFDKPPRKVPAYPRLVSNKDYVGDLAIDHKHLQLCWGGWLCSDHVLPGLASWIRKGDISVVLNCFRADAQVLDINQQEVG